ncbi:FemAB family PEP-CTERM system-associated protein [Geminicoccaceae bacterium 1502E]|nr:FemAB family PEP-CTERM system-associated protein [Geminicoccaceae bacterium 1502E]
MSGGTMPATIRPMREDDRQRWDAFVEAHPQGRPFHLSAWRQAVQQGLGHDCPWLLAERDGAIRGVLPLVRVKSPLFGHALISTGFAVEGGPLAVDAETVELLVAAAEAPDMRRGARLELRSAPPERAGWTAREGLYYGFRKPLDPDPERNLQQIRRKQRAVIRKGLAMGLQAAIDPGIERFFAIYAASVHRLGTPVFPKRWFAALARAFNERCEVLTVVQGGHPLASVMSLYWRGEVLPYYGGSLPEGRALAASDVMYAELMRHAVAVRGASLFDFGRSKAGTGAFDFKRHWGFMPEPLVYGFWSADGAPPPEINPLNPRYAAFVAVWKRLPLPLTKILGPPIARQLG